MRRQTRQSLGEALPPTDVGPSHLFALPHGPTLRGGHDAIVVDALAETLGPMSCWAVYVDLPRLLSLDEAFNAQDALDTLVADGGCTSPRKPTYTTTEIYFTVEAEGASAAQAEGERLARAVLERAGLAPDFAVVVQRSPDRSSG
jgi:hypothetical protein